MSVIDVFFVPCSVSITGIVSVPCSVSITGVVCVQCSVSITGIVCIQCSVSITGVACVQCSVCITGIVCVQCSVSITGIVCVQCSVYMTGIVCVQCFVCTQGAVSLALALDVQIAFEEIDQAFGDKVLFYTSVVVILTLLVNAPLTYPLLGWLQKQQGYKHTPAEVEQACRGVATLKYRVAHLSEVIFRKVHIGSVFFIMRSTPFGNNLTQSHWPVILVVRRHRLTLFVLG